MASTAGLRARPTAEAKAKVVMAAAEAKVVVAAKVAKVAKVAVAVAYTARTR